MELQATSVLAGENAEKGSLAGQTHYEWIYGKVLTEPRAREIVLKHGCDVSSGVHDL